MKELVIISGKGGTGKTSVSAAFASLAGSSVIADCDVDAADLHLVLSPEVIESGIFESGKLASIDEIKCVSCGRCLELCRFEAVKNNDGIFSIEETSCEGCGVCVHFCPANAIVFYERKCGEWYISKSRFGTVSHARLFAGAENSGKLVSLVRKKAKEKAVEENKNLIITDGPPGIGCPVIASITGADIVLIVTEPTLSGEHDLERIASLVKHFRMPFFVCVNRFDVNEEITSRIEKKTLELGGIVAGRIPYSKIFTQSQIQALTVMESDCVEIKNIIKSIWEKICHRMMTI
jgi:MinD superfamily P-loop ATPase